MEPLDSAVHPSLAFNVPHWTRVGWSTGTSLPTSAPYPAKSQRSCSRKPKAPWPRSSPQDWTLTVVPLFRYLSIDRSHLEDRSHPRAGGQPLAAILMSPGVTGYRTALQPAVLCPRPSCLRVRLRRRRSAEQNSRSAPCDAAATQTQMRFPLTTLSLPSESRSRPVSSPAACFSHKY